MGIFVHNSVDFLKDKQFRTDFIFLLLANKMFQKDILLCHIHSFTAITTNKIHFLAPRLTLFSADGGMIILPLNVFYGMAN